MCLGKTTTVPRNGKVSTKRRRRVGGVASLQRSIGNRCLLNYNPQGIKGGTVVPPCDFQMPSTVSPVFMGLPP